MKTTVHLIQSHVGTNLAKTLGRFLRGSDMKKLFITIFI